MVALSCAAHVVALDTFDMFSPAYDQPQDEPTLVRWFDEAGLADVDVHREGLVMGRARRAARAAGEVPVTTEHASPAPQA